MSKRFSASGLCIPRFTGACPRWNTFGAFLTPGMIRTQLSQMPDGQVFFGVARTVGKESGGFSATRPQYAIGLGCDVSHAGEMVYADGLNLASRDALVPVGPSCRLVASEWIVSSAPIRRSTLRSPSMRTDAASRFMPRLHR